MRVSLLLSAALLLGAAPLAVGQTGQGPVTPNLNDTVVRFDLVGVTTPVGALTGFFLYDFTQSGWTSVEIHYPNSSAASYGNPFSDPVHISTTAISGAHNSDTTSYDFELPLQTALTPVAGAAIALDPPGTPPQNLNAFLSVDNGTTAPIYPITGGSLQPALGPWTDLFGGKQGSLGIPHLLGTGTLAAGAADQLALSLGKHAAAAALFFGTSELAAPFKGGVLVPAPLLTIPFTTSATGTVNLPFVLPAGVPAGTALYFQFWIQDAAVSHGFSASNGLRAVTP